MADKRSLSRQRLPLVIQLARPFPRHLTSKGDALTYHTPAGIEAWLRDFLKTWRDLRVEAHCFAMRELAFSCSATGAQSAD
jgi:hypothetical protein